LLEFDVTLEMFHAAVTGEIWNDFRELCK